MKNSINFILFQLLWLSCVFGAANNIMWPATVIITVMMLVFLHPRISHPKDKNMLYICIILGFIIDSSLAYFTLIDYQYDFGLSHIAPFWIMYLWAGFALTLNHSMTWLLKKPYIGTLFILVGAPLSYFSAGRLQAIQIHESLFTLSLISVLWFIVYQILLALNTDFFNQSKLNHA